MSQALPLAGSPASQGRLARAPPRPRASGPRTTNSPAYPAVHAEPMRQGARLRPGATSRRLSGASGRPGGEGRCRLCRRAGPVSWEVLIEGLRASCSDRAGAPSILQPHGHLAALCAAAGTSIPICAPWRRWLPRHMGPTSWCDLYLRCVALPALFCVEHERYPIVAVVHCEVAASRGSKAIAAIVGSAWGYWADRKCA